MACQLMLIIISSFIIILCHSQAFCQSLESNISYNNDNSRSENEKIDTILANLQKDAIESHYKLESLLNDNMHSKTIVSWVTILIPGMGLIIVVASAMIGWQGRSSVRDIVEDFRYMVSETEKGLNNIKDEVKILQDKLDNKATAADKLYDNFENQLTNLLKEQKAQIRATINYIIEQFLDIFPDKKTMKQFEVVRSKTFYNLGDSLEKVRSLQSIGFHGTKLDIPFLEEVIRDSGQTEEIIEAAKYAIKMIQKSNDQTN